MNPIRNRLALLALLLITASFLQSCADKIVRTYEANSPIYQSMEEWRASEFTLEGPRVLENPGKIYIYGRYLLVNEYMRGVHFFDNANPAAPVNLGFLPVMANMDMAINNNVLYLDHYTDLLAFDISNPSAPRLLDRVEDIFFFNNYGVIPGYNPRYPASLVDDSQGVVVGWEVKTITEQTSDYYLYSLDPRTQFGVTQTMAMEASTASNFSGSGIGGSMARFTIWDNHLYTLQDAQLDVFDVTSSPRRTGSITINRLAETLFPQDGKLYIGTTSGMIVYDLGNPAVPTWISEFDHMISCDPVVVQGDKAFVTLSSGRNCGGNLDVLEVIDLAQITSPSLIASYPMTNPIGLGVDGDLLFLCDGPDGLKVFEKSDLNAIDDNLISHFPGIQAFDVIPWNGVLIMTSEEGIYQYDYSDPNNIVQLSHLPISL